jgi:molecular chaperone GrpE
VGDTNTDEKLTGDILDTMREQKVSELDILRQSLEEKDKKCEQYVDQLKRLQAEFDNYRKRADKEKQTHLQWGKEDILLKQISLLDILEQACRSVSSAKDIATVAQGIELIKSEFERVLSAEGVQKIEALNAKFDPAMHDAMIQVENDSVEEGTVLEVLQNGYQLSGRTIRPAKVKVAKKINKTQEIGG